ncbi:hypothetical protein RIF29_19522 [Crotalaria pallida]|uniref:Exocyst complex subunit EXOC6/Sec15 C-terminal domain-containing protein n=1 Tax=Crotalaria pallida TaxID=3830 RepID=A0AAN9EZN1_CROPI
MWETTVAKMTSVLEDQFSCIDFATHLFGLLKRQTRMEINNYVHEIIIYLDSIMSTAQQILPFNTTYKVGSGAFEHIVPAFSSDSVKRSNANAVRNIDHDLRILRELFREEVLLF